MPAFDALAGPQRSGLKDKLLGLTARVADVLQRESYAEAGAVEELAVRKSGVVAALRRAGTELFSGVGGLHGEKKAFGDLLKEVGAPEMGTLSEAAPFAFSQTGKGWRLEEHGPLDFTGRGTVGSILDIGLSPSTYLGGPAALRILSKGGKVLKLSRLGAEAFGAELKLAQAAKLAPDALEAATAEIMLRNRVLGRLTEEQVAKTATRTLARKEAAEKIAAAVEANPEFLSQGGIKWMGLTIPGTPRMAAALSGVSARGLAAVGRTGVGAAALSGVEHFRNAIGHLFDPVHGMPEEWVMMRQSAIDGMAAYRAALLMKAREALKPLGALATDPAFIDRYERFGLAGLDATTAKKAKPFSDLMDELFQIEVAKGIIRPDKYLPGYIPHYYENSTEAVRIAMSKHFRPGEARIFPTLRLAKEKLAGELAPVYDLREILRRRIGNHAQAAAFSDLATDLTKSGFVPPYSVAEMVDLARPATGRKLSAAETGEFLKVQAGALRGMAQPEIAVLSGPARQEYFRQRFLGAHTREEFFRELDKAAPFAEDLPKIGSKLATYGRGKGGFEAVTGIKTLRGVELPSWMVDDVAQIAGIRQGPAGYTGKALRAAEMLLRPIDALTDLTKFGVTVPFPQYHFLNTVGNAAQTLADTGLSALSPRIARHTIGVMGGLQGEMATRFGERYGYEELRMLGKAHGISVGLGGALNLSEGPLGRALSKAAFATRAEENIFRWQQFLNHLRRGMSPEQAAAAMKKALFDYKALTPFEQSVMRRVIPFYTWTRKNIGFQLDTLKTHPGRLGAQVKALTGSEAQGNEGAVSRYGGQQFSWALGTDFKTLHTIHGIRLPVSDLDKIWSGSVEGTIRSWLGQSNPVGKALFETAAGASLFSGRKFTKIESESAGRVISQLPKTFQEIVGYEPKYTKYGAVRHTFDESKYNALIRSFALSRLVSTSDKAFKLYAKDRAWGPVLLQVGLGLKIEGADLEAQDWTKVEERMQQLAREAEEWRSPR